MTKKLKFEIVPLSEVPEDDNYAAEETSERQPLVLVVDDEQIIADTLSIILATNGFTTKTAYSAEAALKICSTIKPDLLLTDVSMPGMSGVDLAIITAETIPGCKVLLFSGQASTADLLQSARDAGHEFHALAKPVHPTDMLRQVAWHLGLEPNSSTAREFRLQ
jgi:DNA-binding NtrC family response regulator